MTTCYNRRPYGSDVQRTIQEDTRYTVRAADFGFYDADRGQALAAVRIDTLPTRGSLWLGGVEVVAGQVVSRQDIDHGHLVYVPPTDASGQGLAAFTFSVRDSAGAFDRCPNCFSFNVCATNDAPVAVDDLATTRAGQAIVVDVRANDRDADDARSALKVTGAVLLDPAQGTVAVHADGTLTFVPAAGVTGNVEIDYTIADPSGLADTGRVTVCVQPAAEGPQCVAFDFSGATATDGADGNVRAYSAAGVSVKVTAFARDDGTGAWSAAYVGAYGGGLGVTDSAEGSGAGSSHTVDNLGGRDNYLVFSFDQQVVLDKAYLGYVVCDSDLQVWVGTVAGAYAAPPALDDEVLRSLGFTEVNRTTLTGARWAELNAGGVAGNVIVVAADTTDLSPEDAFKLQKLAVCTVPAPPADHPPEGADARRAIDEDTFYTVLAADLGFRDADAGQTLAAVRIDTLPAQGLLTLDGVAVTAGQVVALAALQSGLLRITPAAEASGPGYASFTFSVQDSAGRFDLAPNTFVLDVNPVNDGPVARPDAGSVGEDAVLVVGAAAGVIAGGTDAAGRDTDVDGDTLQVSAVAFDGQAGAVGRPIAGAHGSLTLAADGAYRYQPSAAGQALDDGESVRDVFTYTVSDGRGGSASSTLTVTVHGANDAPLTAPDQASTPEGTPVSGQVLANDGDVDGEALAVASFSVQGLAGSFAAGSMAAIDGVGSLVIRADGSWSFTPAAGHVGPVPQATYLACDGSVQVPGTLDITVTPVNLPPTPQADIASTPRGTPLAGNVLANDSDPDRDPLVVLRYAVEGQAGSAAVAVPLELEGVGRFTLQADGRYEFIPAAGYASQVPRIVYVVSDGEFERSATLDITVVDDNLPPALADAAGTLSEEGLALGLPDGLGTPDTTDARQLAGAFQVGDADGDTVTLTLQAPTAALTSRGESVVWVGDGSATLVGWAGSREVMRVAIDGSAYRVALAQAIDHPVAGAEDALQIEFGLVASDGRAQTTATLQVTVEDDAPAATHVVQRLAEGVQQTNVLLVLDLSGSMTDSSGVFDAALGRNLSRLELERQAIERLLEQYDARGDVRVRIVTFSTQAAELGDGWTDVATARAQLATLAPGGFTNYDAPLEVATGAFADPGKLDVGQNVAYFLSDGNPNTPDGINYDPAHPDIGIQADEEAAWRQFLDANRIQAFGLGLGGAGVTQSNLDPVAYDGNTGTDRDGFVVTDLGQLADVLVATVGGTASGRLGLGARSGEPAFGADGGQVRALSVDGTTYTFDPAGAGSLSVAGSGNGRFDAATHILRVETAAGGVLVIDLDDGNYRYAAPANPAPVAERIDFVLADLDGDTAQGSLSLTLDGAPLVGQAGVADVFRWSLADAGAPGAAAESRVQGFEADRDTLDLRDLLQGESAAGDLEAYLALQPAETGTRILVSSTGQFAEGVEPTAVADATLALDVDLAGALGLPPGAGGSQVLQDLLRSGKLVVDA